MRRAAITLAFGLLLTVCAFPQEPAAGAEPAREAEQSDPWIWWKWANFAILAGSLGYIMAKSLPPVFKSRAREIHQAIADAARVKQEAKAEADAIESRWSGIQKEIEGLRKAATEEIASEAERIRRETERHLQRIQGQATQEIALMARAARTDLQKYSAALAMELAEQRIRARLTTESQGKLVDAFVQDLRSRPMPGVGA